MSAFTLQLDTQDFYQVPQNVPFSVHIGINSHANSVTLAIPAISFTLPDVHDIPIPAQVSPIAGPVPPTMSVPAGGYVYTKSNFLPENIRPNTAVGLFFPRGDFLFIITRDGQLRITAPDRNPFSTSGSFTSPATVLTYPLSGPQPEPHTNFQLSVGSSSATKFNGFALIKQYYDLYWGDFYNGVFASYWADNSVALDPYANTPPYNFQPVTRTGRVTCQKSPRQICLEPKPIVQVEAPLDVFFTAGTIAINPTRPDNLVWTSIYINNAEIKTIDSAGPNLLQLWRGVSNDGGVTWPVVSRIDGRAGIPFAYSDSNGLFDRFGNHWITSLWYDPSIGINGSPDGLMILISSDGGNTYKVAYNPDLGTGSLFDFNQLAFGGDGKGGWALWFCNNYYDVDDNAIPTIGYIPVTGLGAHGSGTIVYLNSLANLYDLGTLDVSNDGQIFMYSEAFGPPQLAFTYEENYLFYKAGGVNNLQDGSFSMSLVSITNQGILYEASPGLGTVYVDADNIRGNIGQPIRGVQYDNVRKVAYLLVFDIDPIYSQNMTIYLITTRDGGVTYSAPYVVRDTQHGNVVNPGMKLDPISGDLYITWYDSRNDPQNQRTEFMATVVPVSTLEKIAATIASSAVVGATYRSVKECENNANALASRPRAPKGFRAKQRKLLRKAIA